MQYCDAVDLSGEPTAVPSQRLIHPFESGAVVEWLISHPSTPVAMSLSMIARSLLIGTRRTPCSESPRGPRLQPPSR